MIDDGSTDGSPEICDKYQSRDNRIRVVHKQNGGVSEARNTALEMCTGEYIAFVDGDDYIEKKMYELLIQCMHQHEVEIAVCNWQWETDTREWTVTKDSIPKELYGEHRSEKFAEFLYWGGYANCTVCCLWKKLYKKQLFKNERFRGRISEDEDMNDRFLSKGYILPE